MSQRDSLDQSENPYAYDLTAYLKTLPRLEVVGIGDDARVTVRGDNNYTTTTGRPLYVVDGSPYGFDYRTIYYSIDVEDIASLKVLHGITQVSKYGEQAVRGVIEINLKEGAAMADTRKDGQ